MSLLKALRKLLQQLAHHRPLFLGMLLEQFLQLPLRLISQLRVTTNLLTWVEGNSNFRSRNVRSQTVIKPLAPVFLGGHLCNLTQAVVAKKHFDSISRKGLLVLAYDAAFRCLQNEKQVLHVELLADDTDRQTPDNSGSKPKSIKSRV